jgi:hypothetical protein
VEKRRRSASAQPNFERFTVPSPLRLLLPQLAMATDYSHSATDSFKVIMERRGSKQFAEFAQTEKNIPLGEGLHVDIFQLHGSPLLEELDRD